MGNSCVSGLPADSEKSSDASQRCRLTRAMASTKVGDGLSYQAAVRWVMFLQRMGGYGGPGKEAQQSRRGAGNGQVRPLALGLHAQVGPHLLKGDLQLPAQDKPFQDLGRVRRRVGAEQGLGVEDALRVADQHPAQEYRRLAGAVPDRGLGGEFHGAGGAVVPVHGHAGPSCVVLIKERFQRWPSRAFQWWTTVLLRFTAPYYVLEPSRWLLFDWRGCRD